jgi:hypothetical protein
VANPEGKRLLEEIRRRWKDNIEMDRRETGFVDKNLICQA